MRGKQQVLRSVQRQKSPGDQVFLDVIFSGVPDIVESLVLVAMPTLVVSHRVLNQMRLLVPGKSRRYTPFTGGNPSIKKLSFLIDHH